MKTKLLRFDHVRCAQPTSLVVAACALAMLIGTVMFVPALRASRSQKQIEQQLIDMNRELVSVEVRRDMVALNDLLTPDYVHVHTNGWVESRADFLDDFKSSRRIYHSVDLQDVHVHVYDRSALVMGTAHVKSASGGEKDNINRFLAAWVNQHGKWRLAMWMTTRLQDNRAPWDTAPAGAQKAGAHD
ncbi:MAG: nuclear transport factor 2 family protein [Terriglobales bacterium]